MICLAFLFYHYGCFYPQLISLIPFPCCNAIVLGNSPRPYVLCYWELQDTQRVFRIPHTAVLGMLLAHLGLSPAQYERVVHEDGKTHVVNCL